MSSEILEGEQCRRLLMLLREDEILLWRSFLVGRWPG